MALERLAKSSGIRTEAALKPRDDALNARSEVAQRSVDPRTPGHLVNGYSSFLAECDIQNAENLHLFEVLLGGEPPIECHLLRRSAADLDVSLNHRRCQRGICGVATRHDDIKHEPRLAGREE
ncbi:hypothetical protein WMF16_05760 [Sorangium sp. So ce388]